LQSEAETAVRLLDDWFDPIEAGLRDRVREFIQAMIESELETALAGWTLSRPSLARVAGYDLMDGGDDIINAIRHGRP
jgi:hypothetical protein